MSNQPLHSVPVHTYSHDEELERWKREYLEIKELISQEMEALSGQQQSHDGRSSVTFHERRSDPRYFFMADSKIYAHMGPRAFPILNISIGGLAFYSDIEFEPGTKLLMSALGMIALDVEVLSCDMEETDEKLMEYQYRVRARFSSHVNGYQVYVLAREMHLQNLKLKGEPEPLNLGAKP